MASKTGSVWAVDIGNNSLKALRLSEVAGAVLVTGFDHIRHGKILSGKGIRDTERDELVALSLHQFVSQNVIGKDDVVVSVPSQNSFARFVNLPPVEPKRIPEIVQFEAAQQIPFDINDVQWDWQLMTEGSEAETRVGIFAIKNDVVTSIMDHFSRENILVGYVQMAPMALYNYLLYDRPKLCSSNNNATIILNIGAENTDLVVCNNLTVWQRCIPMGGNTFTRAISDSFKLDFEKAEKLKRTAAMSKYARQILQAMKPVFTDLASEIQRSLGFYSSSNPNTKLSRVIAMGGGTKMRGLLKYLQQSLQIPIERPDSFKRLTIGEDVSKAKFHENVSDFGVVYGLALQGLGLAKIESNLLPRSVAKSMAWAGKTKYFIAAASLFLLVSVMFMIRMNLDKMRYAGNESVRREIGTVIRAAGEASGKLRTEENKASGFEAMVQKEFELFNNRNIIPQLHELIISVLPNEKNNPEQKKLYQAFKNNDVETILKIPRKQRKQIFITDMSIRYTDDVATADFAQIGMLKGGGGKIKGGGIGAIPDMFDLMGGMGRSMEDAKYKRTITHPKGKKRGISEDVGGGPGFLITMAGYSPYEALAELIEPAGVQSDMGKWGVVTRLMNLDKVVDGNSSYQMYGRTKSEHFDLETGDVDLNAEMPVGIGIEDVRETEKIANNITVLIDPMTKEVISKVVEENEFGKEKLDSKGNVVYKVNDKWFILNIKLIWKDKNKDSVAGAPKVATGMR